MFDWMLASYLRNCQFLSDAAADVRREHWKLFAAQSRLGLALWNVLLGDTPLGASLNAPSGGAVEPRRESHPGSLEIMAAERMKEGLAPPREIYDVHIRARIDWSCVPEWAKPIDPELFEGSAHEG